MIAIPIRKWLAEAAMFIFLLTVSPVYAMSEIESRESERPAVVQMAVLRERRRALDRRHGQPFIHAYYLVGAR